MKFLQLGLGERFEFEGEAYTKASPMIASRDRDGASRAVPRSANVKPLGRGQALPHTAPGDDALQRLHAGARALIVNLPLSDEAARAEAVRRLDRLYQELADAG